MAHRDLGQNMDSNRTERTLYAVHGPGPGPGPPDQQQALIQQLKRELETCVGKIKGYETLGHLLQESKQECARYKQTNDELAKKLDSLTRHLPPREPGNEIAGAAHETPTIVPAVVAVNLDSGVNLTKSKTSFIASNGGVQQKDVGHRPSMNLPINLPAESESRRVTVNLGDVTARTPPQRLLEKSLSTSSASFVQISNSETGSPTPLLSGSFGDGSAQQPEKSAVGFNASTDKQTSMDISSEISHITEHLRTIGCSGSASVEDLAGDLIKAGVNVIKLQKQSRVQQVMMDQMLSQITELKADNDAKHQTIQMLQKDCDSLRNTMKRMEVARDQALKDARVKFEETATERDELTGGPSSVEWVEVETHQQHINNAESLTETSNNQTVVTAVPMVEMELRRRIEKLNGTISELVSVNHSWDEHCRQIEATHEQQVAALQLKLNEVNLRLEEYERGDQQRQIDFDNILLGAKKQREAEELAKEEALSQLHMERQQRLESEQKCIEFSRKTVELEQRLIQRQNSRQVELTHNLQTAQLMTNSSSDKEKELMTQLLILQEQVSVFKEDFDQERRDRESTRANMEKLRKKQAETSEQLTVAQSQVMQLTMELNTAKSESERWQQRFNKLSDDVQSIQRQARPSESRVITGATVVPSAVHVSQSPTRFVTQQLELHNTSVHLPSWTCMRCTFKNPGERIACEMCGKPKSDSYLQPNFTSVTGGRSVAGLQDVHPAMPNAGLRIRRLETDFIDDRVDSRR